MIFKFCDTNVNILTYVPLSMQTSKMELTNEDRKNLKDFSESLKSTIGYIEEILAGDLSEIDYLYRDFVSKYPNNAKNYQAIEDMNRRYEELSLIHI